MEMPGRDSRLWACGLVAATCPALLDAGGSCPMPKVTEALHPAANRQTAGQATAAPRTRLLAALGFMS